MERIQLTKSCKNILLSIQNKQYNNIPKEDTTDLLLLEQIGLINVIWSETGCAIIANLSDKGAAYLCANPKLRNPSILEDKKFWINTAISFGALIVAVIALLKD